MSTRSLTGPIGSRGPIVAVEVSLHPTDLERYRQTSRTVPMPYRTRGIVDTAAQNTCVTTGIVRRLRLDPVRYDLLHTASGGKRGGVFNITVQLGWDQGRPPDPISVFAHEVAVVGAEVLIGLDVLRFGTLLVDGPNYRYELLLPKSAD